VNFWNAVLAQSNSLEATGYTTNPIAIGFGLILLIIEIYCAYKTAANGRWVLFIIGFCFPLLWIIGALLGRKSAY
jgi:hypothetical protein